MYILYCVTLFSRGHHPWFIHKTTFSRFEWSFSIIFSLLLRALFSRLYALANLRENKVIANKKCFTVHVLHLENPWPNTKYDHYELSCHTGINVSQTHLLSSPVSAQMQVWASPNPGDLNDFFVPQIYLANKLLPIWSWLTFSSSHICNVFDQTRLVMAQTILDTTDITACGFGWINVYLLRLGKVNV